jgi:hypothetical protein
MKSKTIKLINRYARLLREQGEDPSDSQQAEDPPLEEEPVEEDVPEEDVPPTSQAEDRYVQYLIDAALFIPSPTQHKTLNNLQSIVNMKQYKNARQEILPFVLPMIGNKSRDEKNFTPSNTSPDKEELPFTAQMEEDYIKYLIIAALFEPSSDESATLWNLQSVMSLKRYTNSRDEICIPFVLPMITTSSEDGSLKKDLDAIQ